jgi:hypothetical protein
VSNNWSNPTTLDEVRKRAGGRRHYNAWRGHMRLVRRAKVSRLLRKYGLFKRGTVRAIARDLGVHPATVCRDIQALLRQGQPCPHCGALPVFGPDRYLTDVEPDAAERDESDYPYVVLKTEEEIEDV